MAAPPINKLLVPLDGSRVSEKMVPYVAGLAKAAGSGIVLFQAVPENGDSETAEAYLEGIASGMRESGLRVATESTDGNTAEEIVAAARRYETGLIVMTGHSSEQGRKDLLGSTAHSVLRICDTPVLVVPLNFTSYTPPSAIVVGHDGTVNSSAVLEPAIKLAKSISCDLTLVRAVEPVSGLGGAAKYYSAVDDFAEDDLKALRDELAGSGCNITTHVGKRPPEQELLAIANSRPGSIIAVSTSSLSSQVGVMGSTTDRLVRSQTHAVLAVPER